jgi:hypothetical protein
MILFSSNQSIFEGKARCDAVAPGFFFVVQFELAQGDEHPPGTRGGSPDSNARA